MARRKNSAAVALAQRSVRARFKSLTKEQRSEQARLAVKTRWARKKPPAADSKSTRWFGLFAIPSNDGVHPSGEPELVGTWSHDRTELIERARSEDRPTVIFDVDYDPTKFTIVREFKPDLAAQVHALKTLLDTDEGDQQ